MEGYGDDEGFLDYIERHGYDTSAFSTATDYSAARLRGSQYVDGTYEARFLGRMVDWPDQERSWPRNGVPGVDSDDIPNRVVWASYEAAYLEITNPGSLSAIMAANERVVEVRAGSAGVKFSSEGSTLEGMIPMVSKIEGLLAPLLKPIGGFPAAFVV